MTIIILVVNYLFVRNRSPKSTFWPDVRLLFEVTTNNSIRTSWLNFVRANLPNKGLEYVVGIESTPSCGEFITNLHSKWGWRDGQWIKQLIPGKQLIRRYSLLTSSYTHIARSSGQQWRSLCQSWHEPTHKVHVTGWIF